MADGKISVAVNGCGVIGKRVAAAVFSAVHLPSSHCPRTAGRPRGSGGPRGGTAHVTPLKTVKPEVSVSVW